MAEDAVFEARLENAYLTNALTISTTTTPPLDTASWPMSSSSRVFRASERRVWRLCSEK